MEPCIETIPMGASIYRFLVPSKNSSEPPSNIVLSFPHPDLFATHQHPHFSNTIGRTTNRINNARLDNLNGKTYPLAENNGNNNLHGGNKGWGKHAWNGPQKVKRGTWDSGIKGLNGSSTGEREGLLYTLDSPDGDEGFPGDVEAKVWYFEGRGSKGEIVLDVEYEAKLSDAPGKNKDIEETVIGMTNHAYFNLNPPPPTSPSSSHFLSHHTATLATSTHLPLSSSSPGIPTGSLAPHPNVPLEPNTPFPLTNPLSSTARDSVVKIDDCFLLPPHSPETIPLDTRPQALQVLATLKGEVSGITLRVESTEPAFQFYTGLGCYVPPWEAGEGSDGRSYEGGDGYGHGAGVCVEPSRWVDCVSREREGWRGMGLLKKGGVFGARIRYVAWRE